MGMKSNCGKTSHFKKQDKELREESMLLHIKRVSEKHYLCHIWKILDVSWMLRTLTCSQDPDKRMLFLTK